MHENNSSVFFYQLNTFLTSQISKSYVKRRFGGGAITLRGFFGGDFTFKVLYSDPLKSMLKILAFNLRTGCRYSGSEHS